MKDFVTWPGGEWETVRLIGKGGFGSVYEIQRKEFGKVYRAAMKVMRIPPDDSYTQSMIYEGVSRVSIAGYYADYVRHMSEEFALLSTLKGYTNIVSYEDHKVIRDPDGIGWTILIRMELLTPVRQYLAGKNCDEETIIRLGTDICKALEICHGKNILHRDIKPDNIFVNESGDFELGDFGIAKNAEGTLSAVTKTGTPGFMAPEAYRKERYGPNADLYSLGIVLYMFLNRMRGPFYPVDRTITPEDRKRALNERLSGKPIPEPLYGSARLKKVILKSLAYRPEDRYRSAEEFHKALLGVADRSPMENAYRQALEMERTARTRNDFEKAEGAFKILGGYGDSRIRAERCRREAERLWQVRQPNVRPVAEPVRINQPNPGGSGKRITWLLIGGGVLIVLLLAAFIWVMLPDRTGERKNTEQTIETADTAEHTEESAQTETEETSSEEKTLEDWTKEAEAGDSDAMYRLGKIYYFGDEAEQDYDLAFEWFEKAAAASDTGAMCFLGNMYRYGYGIGQDYERTLEWYEKAAEGGNTAAMNNLGRMYETGEGVEADPAAALGWYEKAAEGGNTVAMVNLGKLYADGNGAKQDDGEARYWYEKAAEGGEATAMNYLGVMYENGKGVEKNLKAAKEWFEKGAETGNGISMYHLGRLYENGIGVEKDLDKAMEWYQKGAEAGCSSAEENLERLQAETGS